MMIKMIIMITVITMMITIARIVIRIDILMKMM